MLFENLRKKWIKIFETIIFKTEGIIEAEIIMNINEQPDEVIINFKIDKKKLSKQILNRVKDFFLENNIDKNTKIDLKINIE